MIERAAFRLGDILHHPFISIVNKSVLSLNPVTEVKLYSVFSLELEGVRWVAFDAIKHCPPNNNKWHSQSYRVRTVFTAWKKNF